MSFAQNELIGQWEKFPNRTVLSGALAAGQRLFKGSMCAIANGLVYQASDFATGKPLASLPLQVPSAAGVGILGVYSNQENIRYQQVVSGTNTPLSVSVAWLPGNTTIDVVVNLATDGGGVVTSTLATVMNAILAHGIASKLLRVYPFLAGAGISTSLAPTAVPQINLLGIAEDTYDNLAGGSTLFQNMGFTRGIIRLAGLATDVPTQAMVGGDVAIVDNTTVQATVNSSSLTLKLANVTPDGAIFCWIE